MQSLAKLLCASWLVQAGLFEALQPVDHLVCDTAYIIPDHAALEGPRVLDHEPSFVPVPVLRVKFEQDGYGFHHLRGLLVWVPVASNFGDCLVFGLLYASHNLLVDADGRILLLFSGILRRSRPWPGNFCSGSLLLYKALK